MKAKIVIHSKKPKEPTFGDLEQGEYFLNAVGDLRQKIESCRDYCNSSKNVINPLTGELWSYSKTASITNQKSVTITVEK
jgi:hypothetical protein